MDISSGLNKATVPEGVATDGRSGGSMSMLVSCPGEATNPAGWGSTDRGRSSARVLEAERC